MTADSTDLLAPGDLAIVVGAGGGIGSAFVDALCEHGSKADVLALSRARPKALHERSHWHAIDTADEASISAASAAAGSLNKTVRLVIVASGTLHNGSHYQPEKTWGTQTRATFESVFLGNTIGPALVAKHFLPLLDKERRSVFAALSARVGSISDNRLGGWHAYRASKAALNMLMQNYSIELRRRNPSAVCLGLHPGTVDTALSKPFRNSVSPDTLFSPPVSVGHMLDVINRVESGQSGQVLAWDGTQVPA